MSTQADYYTTLGIPYVFYKPATGGVLAEYLNGVGPWFTSGPRPATLRLDQQPGSWQGAESDPGATNAADTSLVPVAVGRHLLRRRVIDPGSNPASQRGRAAPHRPGPVRDRIQPPLTLAQWLTRAGPASTGPTRAETPRLSTARMAIRAPMQPHSRRARSLVPGVALTAMDDSSLVRLWPGSRHPGSSHTCGKPPVAVRVGRYARSVPIARSAMSRSAPPITWVTGGAVSTAAAIRFLLAIFTGFHDLSSRIVLSVIVAVVYFPAIVIVGACVLGFRTFGLRAHDYLREHRKVRRAGLGCLVGYLVPLAAFVVWHGSAVGLVGLRLLLALGFAASTALLLTCPILAELTCRGRWLFLTVPTVCLGTGMFLFAIGVTGVGVGLVTFFGFVMIVIPHDERGSGSKFVALCYLVLGMLLWAKLADHTLSGGTLARWAGETVIAVGVGAATAQLVWRASRGTPAFPRRLGTLVTPRRAPRPRARGGVVARPGR